MKSFTFLVHNIYHMGGTTKSISNLANILSEKGHKVKIISVFKANQKPYFDLHEKIEIKPIIEYNKTVKGLTNIFMNRLNKFTPLLKPKIIHPSEPGLHQFSNYIEKQIIREIKNVHTDIIVGTRASYNILVADYGPSDVLKIGMEHMYLHAHNEQYQKSILESYNKLDLVTTLTNEDKMDYQQGLSETKVIIVPNILKETKYDIAKQNVITAAGRFEQEKGFDLLIESINHIQETMRKYDYQLEIYGDGQEKEHYKKMIQQYGISDIVQLKPTTNQLSKILASSKITAVPSRVEGFGLVILEAMYQSNIVVSYKGCYGPEFLIDNKVNGYLIEQQDIKRYGNQLAYIIENYNSDEIQNIISYGEQRSAHFEGDTIYHQFIKNINLHMK
ncbi:MULTISPECIES: glycosyltransferase [Mammaliicoccus]|uniref:Glycosyltransferase n=1 Tax=Mammaliicoccus fleurettii TaxID=150056 RepID=A0ABS5MJU6_9STAP|nr:MULTISPECIES: glycosyltransferase [Mammaliicoccus]HCN59970.1 glycosyltransferase family 4 protein [Staphylococcus sp.]MBL0847455.1 glycosyltransferase [Mammaliicoccus fleurettii]MBS3671122.1 glycosyltransferase [Mammaliicoccus fleurettii]MBS3696181.1 glycosyltransferase [Mammaliicoccus fleurettii]MBW0764771.1 glycosyltransferase family 4 protein [Mammaliicoccus fleurettii]